MAAVLATSSIYVPEALARPGRDFVKPAVTPVPAVPVSVVASTTTTRSAAPAVAVPKPVWPAAGVADVDLMTLSMPARVARAEGISLAGGPVKVAGLPVTVASTDKLV